MVGCSMKQHVPVPGRAGSRLFSSPGEVKSENRVYR